MLVNKTYISLYMCRMSKMVVVMALVTFSKVKLHWAQLALGLVTFGGSTIPVFIQAHSAWPSLRG